MHCICPKYLDRQACANSVDPDQTAPKEQFDQGLHCLPFSLHFLGSQLDIRDFPSLSFGLEISLIFSQFRDKNSQFLLCPHLE